MTLNDLEPPKKKFLVNFSQSRSATHSLRVNYTKRLKIDQDNLRTKFSALNADFSSPSLDPLGLKKPAQARVKDGYPPKWLFYHYWLV